MVNLFKFKSVENFASEIHTIAFNVMDKNYGTLEIATGDTVNWTHGPGHSIDINGTGDATSSAMTRNSDFTGGTSITFNEEGSFAYECGIHRERMIGTIRVRNRQTTRAANGGATTTSRQGATNGGATTTSRQGATNGGATTTSRQGATNGGATTTSRQGATNGGATTTSRPVTTTARPVVTTTARPAPTTTGTTDPGPTGLSTTVIVIIVILSIFGVALLLYFINLQYPNNAILRKMPFRRPGETISTGSLKYFNY